jgi:phosphatidylserine/phosphatidylglycerophosphate/cardiolipin synthase-like enzyme
MNKEQELFNDTFELDKEDVKKNTKMKSLKETFFASEEGEKQVKTLEGIIGQENSNEKKPSKEKQKEETAPRKVDNSEALYSAVDDIEYIKKNTESAVKITENLIKIMENAQTTLLTTSMIKVDKDEVISELEKLRKILPKQLKQADETLRGAEQYFTKTKQEADAILKQAEKEVKNKVSEKNIVKIAEREAQNIKEEAKHQQKVRLAQTDKFCDDNLYEFDKRLNNLLSTVKSGRTKLHDKIQKAKEDKLIS